MDIRRRINRGTARVDRRDDDAACSLGDVIRRIGDVDDVDGLLRRANLRSNLARDSPEMLPAL